LWLLGNVDFAFFDRSSGFVCIVVSVRLQVDSCVLVFLLWGGTPVAARKYRFRILRPLCFVFIVVRVIGVPVSLQVERIPGELTQRFTRG